MRIVNELERLKKIDILSEFNETISSAARYVALKGSLTPTFCHPGRPISPGGGNRLSRIENDDIRRGDLHIFRDLNIYYLPKYGVLISEDGSLMRFSFAEASYYLKDDITKLPFVDNSSGQPVFRPPRGIRAIEKGLVCCPWGGTRNYGHWLLDCLPAVAAFMHLKAAKEHKFLFPPLKSWQADHLELIGLSSYDELTDDIYLVKNVMWSSCMDHYLHNPNSNLSLMREIQLLELGEPRGSGLKICISRKSDEKRKFPGVDKVEAAFASNGYILIEPACHSVREQISIFREASFITGFSGAGFANTIYCRPGTKVCEIMSPLMSGIWVRNICALAGCDWTYYNIHDSDFFDNNQEFIDLIEFVRAL